METTQDYKFSVDETQGIEGRGGSDQVRVTNPRIVRSSDLLLRLLALTLTLIAAVVAGVAKETETTSITIVPGLPPFDVSVTAKWHHLSALVYFVVANSIACAYSALSLVLSIMTNRGGKSGMVMWLIVMDLTMVALLFSGIGAAAGVGIIGYKGNKYVQWNKVCNVFGTFCSHIAASLAMSMLSSLVFFFLVLLTASRLLKKSR